ncbi:hypothetical protein HY480_03490 [Candidatus Uhrbacteria bacterium]|nr:hypothetical protein [Candidatus Uhrbacteria bacterium]
MPMRSRMIVLLAAVCGFTALPVPEGDVGEVRDDVAVPAVVRRHPRTWRDINIPSYEQPVASGHVVTLRFDPDLPETAAYTVERVVEGDPSRVISYVPWVHDSRNGPPMPEPYLASLIEVLASLSPTARLIGFEGSLASRSLRAEDDLLHAFILAQCNAPGTFTERDGQDTTTDDDMFAAFAEENAELLTHSMTGAEWISYAVAQRTAAEVIGIESAPVLTNIAEVDVCIEQIVSMSWSCGTPSEMTTDATDLVRMYVGDIFGGCDIATACCSAIPPHYLGFRIFALLEYMRRQSISGDRSCIAGVTAELGRLTPDILDRKRSDDAVRNTLDALAAWGGGRAILVFGMAHHRDIEAAVRRAGATLDLVCMPHLCRAAIP